VEFQGLQNSLPGIIAICIALFVCILSWYSYKNYSTISLQWKIGLSSLRAISLLIVLFLFLNPFFKKTENVQIKPTIAVLLDGSESTAIKKGEYSGIPDYQKIIAELRNAPSISELEFFSFGNSLRFQDPEEFTPNLPATNLYEAIESITTSNSDYNSAILISDGIVTAGKNPIILSSNSSFPIHVIGIGDTSRVKDVSIKNVVTNATGFTETLHSVDVDISHFGFDNQTITVTLASGNEVISSKQITLNKDRQIETINFKLPLNSSGLKQYSVEIDPVNGEWIDENNSSVFSIDVLDSKKRILHIASAIHPDVKALRSILASNENIELSTYTYLGSISAIKNISEESSNFDLIIVHGKINETVSEELGLDEIDVSTFSILLPNETIEDSYSAFQLIDLSNPELFNVQFSLNADNSEHSILELPDINFNSAAPIQSSISSTAVYPESNTLLESNYQNIPTDSPILNIVEQGNKRRSHFNASGWFKMYLSQNIQEREFIETLISNIVDWTSSNPDNRLLKVSPTKSIFNSSEIPIINASLINENGEVESSGIVEITIDGDNFTSDFTMANLNNGNYQLLAPNLPEGRYSFSATARKGNRDIDTQTGEFLISKSNIELTNTIRNDNLLKGIATNSNGLFIDYKDYKGFWNTDKISSSLIAKTEVQENYLFPVRSVYWFLLVLILLGAEWILRKKFALP